MRRAHLAWRLSHPKEYSKQKRRYTHTQLYMLREPGLLRSALIAVHNIAHVHAARTPGSLRSVLVTALHLTHVHAAPANSAQTTLSWISLNTLPANR